MVILCLSLISFAANRNNGISPGELIVKFAEPPEIHRTAQGIRFDMATVDSLSTKYHVRDAVRAFDEYYRTTGDWGDIVVLRYDQNQDPEQVALDFQRSSQVVWAQPNHVFRTEFIPNDSSLSEQWYLESVHAYGAWDITQGDPSAILGIIDTGVQWNHPDLQNILWVNEAEDLNHNGILDSLDLNGIDDDGNGFVDDVIGWDFTDAPPFPAWGDYLVRDNDPMDEMGHGTAVAGIAMAEGNNLRGTAGIAYGCRLMCLRAGNSEGFLQEDDVAAAILYAISNGARAVNMSFGDQLVSPLLREIVEYAYQQGLIMVCSSGNQGSDVAHYPSGYDQTICVGACNQANGWPSFSNVGTALDLVAPGVSMYSTLMGDQWGLFYNSANGTSFSTPVVTGVVGLILSVSPNLNPEQVRNILNTTADDLPPPGWDIFFGHGKVNAFRAVQAAAIGPEIEAQIITPPTDYGFSQDSVTVIGNASGPAFQSYLLFWGIGQTPSIWNLIYASPLPYQIINDTLGVFVIPESPDTTFVLQLAVTASDGTTLLDQVRILYDTTPPIISNRHLTPMIDADHWSDLLEFDTDDITSGFVHLRHQGSAEPFANYSLNYETNHHRILFSQPDFSGTYQYYITVTNRAGLSCTSDTVADLSLTQPPFYQDIFVQKNINLPSGYLLYKATDFNHDGWKEVVLNKYTDGYFDTLKIYESSPSGFIDMNQNYVLVIPQDVGDSDADGKLELMGRAYGTTYVFEATNPGDFPNNLIFRDTTNVYGSNLLDLDSTDSYGEMILRRGQEYIVYRHFQDSTLQEVDELTNTTSGENRLGKPLVEIADLDGDGSVEALYGDYDGDLLIFKHRGFGLFDFVWSDSLPLPDATNWMTVGDFDGDGRKEFIAGCWTYGGGTESEFNAKRWVFIVFDSPGIGQFVPVDTLTFFGAEYPTDYDEGVSSGDVDGDGTDEILLCLYPDFYVVKYNPSTSRYEPIWYYPMCESNLALVTDYDQDGVQEFIFNTGTGMVAFGKDPTRPPAPSNVQAAPIDTTAIVISWRGVTGAEAYQIDRAVSNGNLTIYYILTDTIFTDIAVWKDTTYHYVVHTIDSSYTYPLSPASIQVIGIPNIRPEALSAANFTAPHFVMVFFNEPMNESITYTGHYLIPGWGSPITTISYASGNQVLLAFQGSFLEGGYQVEMQNLWDVQGSEISDSARFASFQVVLDTISLPYLSRATILGPYGISLEFSAAMQSSSITTASNYHLDSVGMVASAVQNNPQSVLLKLDHSVPIGAVGRTFVVSAWNLFDLNGNPIDTLHNSAILQTYNNNLDNVYVYPNPFTGTGPDGGQSVMIAGLTREATVQILNVNGHLLRTLTESNGDGGVLWDLKNQHGERVASGIYLYYISGGGHKTKGKFAVLR
jgi:subtilisin family serine protease